MKIKIENENHIKFYCQGCKGTHAIPVNMEGNDSPENMWNWDSDKENPTISPSINSAEGNGAYRRGKNGMEWIPYPHCHSNVTNGQIIFHGDCDHEFKGTTQPLLEIPEEWQ